MQKITEPTRALDIKREWYLLNAKNKPLGRFASEVALLLIGKNKAYFAKNLDCGDYVVVINAKEIASTGNKEIKKKYYRHSMYPGGFKEETLENLRKRKPTDIIVNAVSGMLPKNKLRDRFLTRLYVFENEKHTYEDKFKINK